MHTTFLSIILTFTLFLVLFFIYRSRRKPPDALILTTYDEIHALLDPPDTSISTLLHRRAVPNARLINAFGIHNSTFTSPSDNVHRVFKKQAIARLRAIDSLTQWQKSKGVIQGAIEFYLPHGLVLGDYSTFMQAVVFTAVLNVLFDRSALYPDPFDVRYVTEGINELWIASKTPSFHSEKISQILLSGINHCLEAWLPQDSANPFTENPLEILLPAYETLWRFVAHGYVYVANCPVHTPPFLEFWNNPTPAQFRVSRDLETPSVHDILQEVLRLHPPTKRIKRILGVTPEPFPLVSWVHRFLFPTNMSVCNAIAADIEALQRSSVWDPLPHEFDAMRHKTSTEVQNQCFMPFGHGPLKCVAANWAPRFAGMLIAGLTERDDVELVKGETLGSREGWGGWKIGRKV